MPLSVEVHVRQLLLYNVSKKRMRKLSVVWCLRVALLMVTGSPYSAAQVLSPLFLVVVHTDVFRARSFEGCVRLALARSFYG
jgi:hypothetical protein